MTTELGGAVLSAERGAQ